MAILLATLPVVAACGRLGFEATGGKDAPDGNPLDGDGDAAPDPVPGVDTVVASGATDQRNPAVVATAAGFVVVFDELIGADRQLRIAALSPAGVLAGGPMPVATTASHASFAAATTDGTKVAVAWEGRTSQTSNIWFGHIAVDGTLSNEVQRSQSTQLAYNPSIVWTGAEYGVAWDDGKQNAADVWLARVSAAGALVGAPVQRSNNGKISDRTSTAWSGSEYGIAWEDNATGRYELLFARVSSAGVVVGTDVRVTATGGAVLDPSLVWTGSEYGVAWADQRSGTYQILFQRLSSAGTPIGTPTVVSPAGGEAWRPKLLWLDTRYTLAWVQNAQVHLATLDSAGSVVATVAIADCSPNPNTKISLVRRGSALGLAWSDVRTGNPDVYFRVVAP